jgi:hypothetical protein
MEKFADTKKIKKQKTIDPPESFTDRVMERLRGDPLALAVQKIELRPE